MDALDLTYYDTMCLLEVSELSTKDDGDPIIPQSIVPDNFPVNALWYRCSEVAFACTCSRSLVQAM